MSDFKTLKGLFIKHVSSDPSNLIEGQIWYNTTSQTIKVAPAIAAWAAGGNLTTARYMLAGCGTQTAGLTAGGYTGSNLKQIQKYQFDTSNNSTNVGDLTAGPNSGYTRNGSGSSSTTYGYRAGGWPSARNEIEKWAFASDGDGTDVGDLTVGRSEAGGTQV